MRKDREREREREGRRKLCIQETVRGHFNCIPEGWRVRIRWLYARTRKGFGLHLSAYKYKAQF